ncbi:MAG: peptidylprolyl isomerase [Sinobacteraceae bacterium]|nr:peptidylprolyl isomerase [Nevskiaceae bacterium]
MIYCRFLLLAGLLGLVACQPKTQDTLTVPADKSPSLATVNGTNISQDFFDQYIKAITGKSSSDLTPEQRSQALDNLVRAEVVGQEAAKQGIDKVPETAALLELTRLNVLQQAMAEKYLKDRKPTEQETRAEYETQVGSLAKLEYHAKHILVATEPFAQKVIERLKKGEKFEDIAKHESMDSSKDNGGDLGWFTPDKMVKPFADAVLALKPGQYTDKPVQTQYGWHVIELVETRDLQPPPYDNVKQRLEQVVQAKKVKAYTDDLIKNAKIEKKLDDAKKPEEKTAG